MKRHKHSLSHYRLTTCEMGRLVPIGCFEVLPGDTVQQATSLLLRSTPLLAPVMHPVSVRVHHWFVPHRLVWDGWEDFITGGPDGTGTAEPYPVCTSPAVTGWAEKTLADYLGVPPGVPNLTVSAMPIRSYMLIANEFYRDQDLVAEWDIFAGTDADAMAFAGGVRVAWEKDYFTSARPWPQKGPDVSLPLGTQAPVIGDPASDMQPKFTVGGSPAGGYYLASASGTPNAQWQANATSSTPAAWENPKLIADLTNATAVNVNDVRRAFALQRYQEARARYGSRYTEYLRYLGVRSSDARLQRPEYLGGGKQTIAFSEVLQTSPGADTFDDTVGAMKGHGIAAMRSRRYRRFFEEHGLVLSLLSIRPRTMYANKLDRLFLRRTKEDYWQKELEQIGQQSIDNREVYAAGVAGDFGFQDRYSEYKHIQSSVHGNFRSVLDHWHLARDFASQPVLNADFVQCEPSKRIYADENEDALWIMVNNSIQARRMVSKGSGSRIM